METQIELLKIHSERSREISVNPRITSIEDEILQAVGVGAKYYCLPYTIDDDVYSFLREKGFEVEQIQVGIITFTKISGW